MSRDIESTLDFLRECLQFHRYQLSFLHDKLSCFFQKCLIEVKDYKDICNNIVDFTPISIGHGTN